MMIPKMREPGAAWSSCATQSVSNTHDLARISVVFNPLRPMQHATRRGFFVGHGMDDRSRQCFVCGFVGVHAYVASKTTSIAGLAGSTPAPRKRSTGERADPKKSLRVVIRRPPMP